MLIFDYSQIFRPCEVPWSTFAFLQKKICERLKIQLAYVNGFMMYANSINNVTLMLLSRN